MDRAIREIGLTRLFAWPGMAVDVADLPEAVLPDGIRVEPVTDERGAAAIAHVEQVGFDSEPEIAERFYAAASYGVEGGRSFVAWDGEDPVGMAAAYLSRAARSGSSASRWFPRPAVAGSRSALSAIAARAFPADLAWLHTDDPQARSVYERLGFREVAQWEVWIRRART